MTHNHTYKPSDDFRAHLEDEIGRRFRHGARSAVRSQPRSTRWAKAAAVVGISVAIGASAGFASAQIRQTTTRDSLLEAANIEAMLAKTRLDIAKAQADDVSAKARAGVVGQDEVAASAAELRDMELRLATVALNINEIRKSGQGPRDDLGAPLVDNRDYVKDRLQLEALMAQSRLNAAEATMADAERKVRAGAEDEAVLRATQLKVLHVQGNLSVLAEQLKARKDFLDKGTAPAELAKRVENAQVRADAAYAQAELSAAKARLATVEKMRAVGTAGDVDLLRAQLAVKELEVELQRLATRLRTAK